MFPDQGTGTEWSDSNLQPDEANQRNKGKWERYDPKQCHNREPKTGTVLNAI